MAATTLDAIPDAVFRLNGDGRVEEVNQAAAGLTGYEIAALVGRSPGALLDCRMPDGEPVATDGWHRSARLRSVGRIPEHEVRLRAADGEEVRVLVTGRYDRDADGRLRGAVLVARGAARRRLSAPAGT